MTPATATIVCPVKFAMLQKVKYKIFQHLYSMFSKSDTYAVVVLWSEFSENVPIRTFYLK